LGQPPPSTKKPPELRASQCSPGGKSVHPYGELHHTVPAAQSQVAVNAKKVALFLSLIYALTYPLAIFHFLAGGSVKPPGILIVGVIYMFMPTLCAVVVQKLIYKAPLKKPLRINFRPNRWFLVAWLLPLLLAVATFGVALLFPGVTFSPDKQDNFR
jgi:hypothetical protein